MDTVIVYVLILFFLFVILQVIRFGHDWDPTCMKMDEVLYNIAEKVKNFAVVYLVDITKVPDFNKMYVDCVDNCIFVLIHL